MFPQAVAAVVIYVALAVIAGGRGIGPICPFLRLTGHSCPLCGTSRAIALAVRGRWSESWAMHPLGLLPATCSVFWSLTRARKQSRSLPNLTL